MNTFTTALERFVSVESRLAIAQQASAAANNVIEALRRFHHSDLGQDIMEYAIIVAFAVTVIAVLAALYNTIKDVLRNANSQLQGVR